MRLLSRFSVFAILILIVSVAGAGCVQQPEDSMDNGMNDSMASVQENGSTNIDNTEIINNMETTGLNESEAMAIKYIREEEKLAQDIYRKLYEIHGLQIFENISDSEKTHTEAVKVLIDKYGLDDPVKSNEPGEYNSEELQQLYNELIDKGDNSLEEGLEVGATVEEVDIVDIQREIENTDNEDVITVYKNLIKGSRNHLRAFTKTMEKRNIDYQPQYLSEEEFTEIIQSPMETG